MHPASSWDWSPGSRDICDVAACSDQYEWQEEFQASPDGEQVAVIVKLADPQEEPFGVCVNGKLQAQTFEKIWYLRYTPDGRTTAIVSDMGEWSVAVDGEAWDDRYAFVWDTRFSRDGSVVTAAVQQDLKYGYVVNGTLWDTLFDNANQYVLGPQGKALAAVVQARQFAQADIFAFQEGCYSVAVNGKVWDQTFVNCWTPVFNDAEDSVACQVRTSLYDYSIAVDGQKWSNSFQCVWDPCFRPGTADVYAPVRQGGKWGIAKNGDIAWKPVFPQCWNIQFSADGSNLWAIVATDFGKWTLARNNEPWSAKVKGAVTDLTVSPDGKRAACIGREGEKWALMADNKVWVGWYDMVWKPVFSPDSKHVAAKVERSGKRYTVVVDEHVYHEDFDQLWDPVFSPEGTMIMLRAIKDGTYRRIVLPLSEF
jgi:hypothetical protein